jgi:hypothetical protein
MQGLRAFVGHSFVERDQELVRIFCDHFDNLKKAHLGFSWDHATEAEPSPLSDKVFGSFEQDANALLGLFASSGIARQKVTRRVEYTLKLRGHVLIGEVKRTTDGETPSMLTGALSERKVLMYFVPDEAQLNVMEGVNFYSLKRLAGD